MTETALTIVEDQKHLVALSPVDMADAQETLIGWAKDRIQEWTGELQSHEANFEIAKKRKWRSEAWNRQIKRAQKALTYYEKVKAALEAGYYLIPPLPIDTFAIRTDRKNPRANEQDHEWNIPDQKPRILPQGQGYYVSNQAEVWKRTVAFWDKGTETTRKKPEYFAKKFREVDFPFIAVKPELLGRAAEAMDLKLFDRVGTVPRGTRQARDPILIGQIIPAHRHPGWGEPDPLNFFIGWWLDKEAF